MGLSEVVVPGTPTSTAAASYQAMLGRACVFLGDSLTTGGTGGNADVRANNIYGDTYPNYACALSMGRLRMLYNAGDSGETSAQVTARLQADVFDKFTAAGVSHGIVGLLQGTNDTVANGVGATNLEAAQATIANDAVAIAAIRAAGHTPVLCLLPPSNSDGATQYLIDVKNAGKRSLARRLGVIVADFHTPLVDPTNGHYLTGKYNDATHPNPFGYRDMGQAFVDAVEPLLGPGGPMIAQANTTEDAPTSSGTLYNTTRNPLLLKVTSTPVPDGYTFTGGSGYTRTLAKDATLGAGNIAKSVGAAGASGNNSLGVTVALAQATGGFAVGDLLMMAVGFRFIGGDASAGVTQCILQGAFTGSSGATYLGRLALSADVWRGLFVASAVVPAGTTALTESHILAGEGELSRWAPTRRNLTTLGIAA